MTNRSPVSSVQNVWYDAEEVNASDLSVEQNYNNQVQSSMISNHIGNGILPETLTDRVLFDSANYPSTLDGVVINSTLPATSLTGLLQPSDTNYGNQLEIELTDSKVAGRRTVKIAIIGLDFEQNMQYETFVFKVNEKQYTKKHYAAILQILINDFTGPTDISFNLGGRIVIKEAKSLTLSRNPVMVSQDVQPNIFFRDFFVDPAYFTSLSELLTAGMPNYNIDSLNIAINELDYQTLAVGDNTKKIGQKFIAKTNNIQKITLLLAVDDATNDWDGSLVLSVYALQTSLQCPTDTPPGTLLGFSPTSSPIAQVIFNKAQLAENKGIKLTSVPQPVDFELSNTSLSYGNVLAPGNYYVFTLNRQGSNTTGGTIKIPTGNKVLTDSKLTVFNGSNWTDNGDQDLWFQIYTDSAKVTDGQAYEAGNGVMLPKTIVDPTTGATVDYSLDNLSFSGNDVFTGVLLGKTTFSEPTQDLRTGNPVYSRQQTTAEVQLLSTLELNALKETTDPLQLGVIKDFNKKFIPTTGSTFSYNLSNFSIINNEIMIRQTNPSDTDFNALSARLVSGDLVNCKIFPNASKPDLAYNVAKAERITMTYGDVNGDGKIDQDDLNLLNTYFGFNFSSLPPATTTDSGLPSGPVSVTNGYITYKFPFVTELSVTFYVLDRFGNIFSGFAGSHTGDIVASSTDYRLASLSSPSLEDLSVIPVDDGYRVFITSASNEQNHGAFDVVQYDSTSMELTLRKVYLTSEVLGQLYRADLDKNFSINLSDQTALSNYVSKLTTSGIIGTTFEVIKLTLDGYVDANVVTDRSDDYYTSILSRNADIHPIPDIYENDGYITSPHTLNFETRLTWNEYLVSCNSVNRLVETIFTSSDGLPLLTPKPSGSISHLYGQPPTYSSGRNDVFVPANLILNHGAEIVRPDGNYYKVDFEVGTVTLEIPVNIGDGYYAVDIFNKFVADHASTGRTSVGYPAMRYADSTFVQPYDVYENKIRFTASIQSYSPEINYLQSTIVDGKMGVALDEFTGLLTINFNNLYRDVMHPTASTKVIVQVFLKKAGFNNSPLYVPAEQLINLVTSSI